MGHKTPPKKLIFVDNLIRGFLSLGLLGSFFGIIIYAVSKSLWITAEFSLALWIITSPLAYFRIYNPALKWLVDERGKPYSRAKREAERVAKTFALEWAVLLSLASITGAALFSMIYPNVLLGVLLVVASSAVWGYIHAKILAPAYTPIASSKKILWISRKIWGKSAEQSLTSPKTDP
ncbi:hypothetical protein [Thermococcus sp.]|uniref:hypothetical protein n=1 Tax=Thermococcus sp. TaxID=35749 RepID=UPI00262E019B|nr:hypothetical protein [Thermococcus sp.]